ncbi:AraC family transcriptional regulator [Luteimonas sp. SJ-92]|uniref:AraC family transcriptional regulator n=2 Tax=Luteimonas salinisoli TaxID=2752307 RepID=A0A853J7R4_9GAMM|nr:AraC family transcriptional regulator [Luteimonas salinisoli]
MQRPATRSQYAARIDKVVAYLSDRLDQPLTLDRLAAVGHFSPHHFHRIYRGMMGETVAETLRRLRLHRAAVELLHGSLTLDAVARRCGYGSSAAFGRAFALAYGLPPGEFRRRQGSAQPPPCPFANQEDTPMYEAKIERQPAIAVAALRHHGPYHDIGQAFGRLGAWAAGRGLDPVQARSFGLYYDDPESKPASELVADACIQVEETFAGDGEFERRTIAGGRYAAVEFVGPYAELERPYRWLFGEWLPASGEEAADAPVVEEYLNDPQSLPPAEWRTAIRLPLRGDAAP